MSIPDVQVKTALVTGCSTGIGRATARVLRERGWQVVPSARKSEDLASLRAEGFSPVRMDVAESASVQATVCEALELLGGRLGALVNNAGYGQPGAVEDLSRDELRRQFEVNVFGLHELTNLCLPVLRKQGWGRIVNVSSVLGRMMLPYVGAYCASKAAVEMLSDVLRIELRGTGIFVSVIEPGPIESAFRKTSVALLEDKRPSLAGTAHASYYDRQAEAYARGRRKPSQRFMAPPEAVARRVMHAVESPRPRRRYLVTLPAHVGIWAARHLPAGLMDLLLFRGDLR